MDSLVSTGWLEEHLGDPDLRIIDATVHLRPGPKGLERQAGRGDYDAGHIPGAAFLDLATELADPASAHDFTRPPRAQLEAALSAVGVSNEHRVVAYSGSGAMWATRLYWILRAAGHDAVAILDGGFQQWCAEKRPISSEPCTHRAASFKASERDELWATADEVAEAIGDGGSCTINALPRAYHTGEAEMGYARPGRIRGSVNVSFTELLDGETGKLLAPDELRRHFEGVGAFERERVITYCGGGIAATLNAFALTLLGHSNVSVYDGSLSEWARDPARPMDTGDST